MMSAARTGRPDLSATTLPLLDLTASPAPVTRPARKPVEASSVDASPAMHVTPNVVSAARGGRTLRSTTRFSDAFNAGALDMRGLRI